MAKKSLLFDTSTVISLVTNNMLWVLPELKKKFDGRFLVAPAVYQEMIKVPMNSRKYKFEAMVVCEYIHHGHIKVCDNIKLEPKTDAMMSLTNSIYKIKERNLNLFHRGEMDTVVLAMALGNSAIATDERSTRMLIEDPKRLAKILSMKLHAKVKIQKDKLKQFREKVGKMQVLRSTEIGMLAIEHGLLDEFYAHHTKQDVVDAVLWGLKTRGCAISGEEIDGYIQLASKKT
ncbi:hypothetical protein CL622_06740 [archaeon]|nr:hypothetical protein [archaeon]|tara:strand:- start:1038 stop:1733 length:696 start_codon:yes stop_codon:yes gene_type:complete